MLWFKDRWRFVNYALGIDFVRWSYHWYFHTWVHSATSLIVPNVLQSQPAKSIIIYISRDIKCVLFYIQLTNKLHIWKLNWFATKAKKNGKSLVYILAQLLKITFCGMCPNFSLTWASIDCIERKIPVERLTAITRHPLYMRPTLAGALRNTKQALRVWNRNESL